jgi:hypothetical protein
MVKQKLKKKKKKYKRLNSYNPIFPKEKNEYYAIGEKVYYKDLYSKTHEWITGIIKSLESISGNEYIIFNIEDCSTQEIYSVNKHLVKKYDGHKPKSQKMHIEKNAKH